MFLTTLYYMKVTDTDIHLDLLSIYISIYLSTSIYLCRSIYIYTDKGALHVLDYALLYEGGRYRSRSRSLFCTDISIYLPLSICIYLYLYLYR